MRADVVAALLREEAPGRAAAVHLRAGRVTGQLRLSYAEVGHPLLLEECDFDEPPDLYWARMSHTSFAGSRMPGFRAANVRVDGHLQLSRCAIGDGVRLGGSQISGGLLLADAVLGGNGAEWAVHARRASIGGDLVLVGARLTGGLAITNARLGGTADLDKVTITAAPGDRAVDADNVGVEAAFYCRWAEVQGEVTLRHARVAAAVSFSRSTVRNPGGVAFRASRATLDGGLYLHDGFVAEGQVRVVSARIVRTLRLDGASLRNPGAVALCADFVTIEGMLDGRHGLTVEGETTLLDATVTGPVHLEGAHLSNPGGAALTAHGLTVGALLQLCDGFIADGRVRLAGAKAGSRICFDKATVRAPGRRPSPAGGWRHPSSRCAGRSRRRGRSTCGTPRSASSATTRAPGRPHWTSTASATTCWSPRVTATPACRGWTVARTASAPSRTSSWPPSTRPSATAPGHAPCCWPSSAGRPRSAPGTRGCGACSRTSRSATGTARCGRRRGCSRCSWSVRSCTPGTVRRGSAPTSPSSRWSTRWTCCCRSSTWARSARSSRRAASNGSRTC
ncbi:hypothetical protein ACFQ1L_20425 [Phytohabitans flavus]|uniref:hypothetical protein n=1 Tax=Phytohabitans flavus TaxID=1076124 RepID=UPI00363E1FF9